jgi:predicted  nucleic acid-binding Zn-ribbon protein
MEARGPAFRIGELFALQDLDSQADAVRAALAGIDERLGNEEALVPLREAVAALEERRRPLAAQQKEQETIVEDGRRHIQREEEKLYSGTITSPRDLDDLQKEVESLQRAQRERDERLLAILSELEEVDSALASARSELAQAQEEWDSDQVALQADRERYTAQLADCESRRQPQAERFSPEVLRLYDQLRKTRAGRAVVRVERGTCQGCRITLPVTLVQRARAGNSVVQCSSCGRILFVG